MSEEWVDLGAAHVSGYEVLSTGSHCQVSRRVRDGALFAEIWVPVASHAAGEAQQYQYIGPVRLPEHG